MKRWAILPCVFEPRLRCVWILDSRLDGVTALGRLPDRRRGAVEATPRGDEVPRPGSLREGVGRATGRGASRQS